MNRIRDLIKRFWVIISQLIFFMLTTIISINGAHITTTKALVKANFSLLRAQIRVLSHADENIYIFCEKNYKQKLKKEIAKNYYSDLYMLNSKRLDEHTKLINTVADMRDEGILSNNSYDLIKKFLYWNDEIGKIGIRTDDVCKMPLKNPDELKKWREEIISYVLKNK